MATDLSSLIGGGGVMLYKYELFTSSGTWTLPTNLIGGTVLVTAIGGGGHGDHSSSTTSTSYGGASGYSVQRLPVAVTGNVTVTIGAGATSANSTGGTTSFGSISCSGGGKIVGGAAGGAGVYDSVNNLLFFTPASGHGGPFGGPAGGEVNVTVNDVAGGGGLILDDSETRAGRDTSAGYGGLGYGAGGAGGTGAPGAVFVEWWETE